MFAFGAPRCIFSLGQERIGVPPCARESRRSPFFNLTGPDAGEEETFDSTKCEPDGCSGFLSGPFRFTRVGTGTDHDRS